MNTAHVQYFVLISILRGQPRTPPSGDNLGVLDYHLKTDSHVVREQCNKETPMGFAYCALAVSTIECCQLEIRGE